ncbi:MAG: energy transducer TonB [Candidatus Kapaibacterium sp.]
MKKLNNLPYGAAELKSQINSSTMKGFILSLMFFMVFGLAISSLHKLVNDDKTPEIIYIPTTVVTNYELEKSIEQVNSGEGAEVAESSREEIGKNQKFIDDIDLPINNASLFDVGINTDDILKNISSAFGINNRSGSGSGDLIVETNNPKSGILEKQLDITKEFVHQDLQKFPSMDYDKIKSLVHYPILAKQMNLSGSVHIAALIDKSGKLVKSYIYSSTNSLFDEEALQAVRNYNDFSPAVNNDRAVDCWIIIPIKFKLK